MAWSRWMASWRTFATTLLALVLAGCSTSPSRSETPLAAAGQVVLVTSAGWDAPRGKLRTFERSGEGWREIGTAREVTLGRTGSAWGLGVHPVQHEGPQKREGDGRSPAGVYEIGPAFGYPARIETKIEYEAMTATDWCVDVPGSPYYNRIVDSEKVGGEAVKDSSEPMRRDLHVNGDQRYRIGFVIEHNPK